jgi:hypothetical protein
MSLAKMAQVALHLYRQSFPLYSFQRIGGVCGVQFALCVAVVRNFSSKMGLPRVYFDMSADNQPVGRIVMEVSRFLISTVISVVKNSVIELPLHCDLICWVTMVPVLEDIVTRKGIM